MIHVVLVEPKMPSNTGNTIRLCANTGATLHLVEPLGFALEDKKLRRAGLDYHEWANVKVHANWQDAQDSLSQSGVQRIVALTTKLSKPLYDEDFAQHGDTFGKGTMGTSEGIRVDMGAGGKDARALPDIVYSSGLRGRSLVQVGENCNALIHRYC